MKAIMLCAGEGTRCRPFTYLSPKMTQQVGGIPILEYMLSWFAGAREVADLYIAVKDDTMVAVLNDYLEKRVAHLNDILCAFSSLGFGIANDNPDLEIHVLRANGWGTGGDLRSAIRMIAASGELGDDFLVCNGDYVTVRRLDPGSLITQPDLSGDVREHDQTTQVDLSGMIRLHEKARRSLDVAVTDALVRVDRSVATRFGVADLEELDGIEVIRGFTEKPSLDQVPETPWVNAGIYVMNSEYVLSDIDRALPDHPGSSLERNLLMQVANERQREMAAFLLDLDAWYDVGTLEQLINTNVSVASREGGDSRTPAATP